MKKRTLIFRNENPAMGQGWGTGESRTYDYDTATYGWTLSGCTLTDPEQKTQYVEKAGGNGSWDLSTVLTDGLPHYKNRTLTATLELSEGTREDRLKQISRMVNLLDGWEWEIIHPDHPDHFLKGRVRVDVNLNGQAYAMVTVTATCEPWLYCLQETVIKLTPSSTEWKVATLWNNGRRSLSPDIKVEGTVSLLTFKAGSAGSNNEIEEQITLEAGTYQWPALFLPPGGQYVGYAGQGSLIFTYREAVLR